VQSITRADVSYDNGWPRIHHAYQRKNILLSVSTMSAALQLLGVVKVAETFSHVEVDDFRPTSYRRPLVVGTDAATTLTKAQSGSIVTIPALTAGRSYTLPLGEVGMQFTFLAVAAPGQIFSIVLPAGNTASCLEINATTCVALAKAAAATIACASFAIGTKIDCICMAQNAWSIVLTSSTAATIMS
jgi:hypothetical protein